MAMTDSSFAPVLRTGDRRFGALLLNQQFWLWGQDIRRPEGNALLAMGCERYRPPAGRHGGTTYVVPLAGGGSLMLWGFGLALVDGGSGLFLSRFRLDPRFVTAAEVGRATGAGSEDPGGRAIVPRARRAETRDEWEVVRRTLGVALAWIAAYERHVVRTGEGADRERCLAGWRRPVGRPDDLASGWDRIAFRIDRTFARALARSGSPGSRPGSA